VLSADLPAYLAKHMIIIIIVAKFSKISKKKELGEKKELVMILILYAT
jgi:hypothetical protein